MAITASPIERDTVWVGPGRATCGAPRMPERPGSKPVGLDTLHPHTEWSFPPRPDTHHVRSIACHPFESGPTLGRNRGRRPGIHNRWWAHLARPSSGWTVGRLRARHSSPGSRHPARLRRRWIFRERRCRRHVALTERRSRGRLLAQRGNESGATGCRRGISFVRTAFRRSRHGSRGWPTVSPCGRRALGARGRWLAGASHHHRTSPMRRRESRRTVGRRRARRARFEQ